MKIILKVFFSLIILFCIIPLPNYALEVETHKEINEKIAKGTINGFSLNNYLKNQLGFQNGYDEVFKFGESKKVWDWIKIGGLYEDKPPGTIIPYIRSANHFHDPLSNKGFGGFFFGLLLSGDASITWSQKPIGTQSPGGYYSWFDTRDYFYKALTSPTKDEKEKYFAETFRGIGQLMHLVQDISVPAHTRNEFHAGYHYEGWVDKNKAQLLNLSPISFDQSILSLKSPLAPVPFANLFDAERYTITNPDPAVTLSNSIGLSEYTNANFFSDLTIFQDYPHPAKGNTDAALREQQAEDGEIDRPYYITGYQSEKLALYSYFANLDITGIPEGWKYTLDDAVYEDYAQKLIPRAVGYSAGLLNYFFRGEIDMVPDYDAGYGYRIVNNTDEDMNGRFELYYDNDRGERRLVQSCPFAIGRKSSGNNKSPTITFSPPADAKESGKYMLVFRGRLGNEEDAVVGKEVKEEKEYLFWVNFKKQTAVFEIRTINNQYQLIPVAKNINITRFNTNSTLLTVQSHPNKKEHVVALPSYFYDKGNYSTTYVPNIARYGINKKFSIGAGGYTYYLMIGLPATYIPKDFGEGSEYIWDSNFVYVYDDQGKSPYWATGRRPFKLVDNRLTAKNIILWREWQPDTSYKYYIRYKDATNNWVKGKSFPQFGGVSTTSGSTYKIDCKTIGTAGENWWKSDTQCSLNLLPIDETSSSTPIDYLAVLGDDSTIRITRDFSSLSSYNLGNTTEYKYTSIKTYRLFYRYVDPYINYWGPVSTCYKTAEATVIDRFAEIKKISTGLSSEKLMIGDTVINEFSVDSYASSGDVSGFGRMEELISPASSTCPTESTERGYWAFGSPILIGTTNTKGGTPLVMSGESNTKGTYLSRVIDYDYIDNNKNYILFYEYNELESSESSQGEYNPEDDSYKTISSDLNSSITIKYKLAYKIDNITEKVDIDVSYTSKRHRTL